MKEEYLHLQHSESVIAQMAATVFSGLMHKQEFSVLSEDEQIEKAVQIAIKLAGQTEKLVKSDEEWVKKNTDSAFLGG